eukprot:TRINITY_DN49202_c0_g1_i1.p1 TRINITY_DN49202_c0_g1~~TRINITY_DN49202_c0_g1_i1.p1  ORF type:complete len:156 (+),score=53.71 TRINITY_DN49202_c0_g1_i1:64-531(+)
MMRAGVALLLLGACRQIQADDDEVFMDSPILTSLWQATSSSDNAALDRLLDTDDKAVFARASDGRGLAWWAYEFQNAYALASILANGGDPESESEDASGEPAYKMCVGDCDKGDLLKKAKGMVEDIKKRKEERAAEREKEEFDDDDDEELGDDEF